MKTKVEQKAFLVKVYSTIFHTLRLCKTRVVMSCVNQGHGCGVGGANQEGAVDV